MTRMKWEQANKLDQLRRPASQWRTLSPRQRQALEYARSYKGNSEFMCDMKDKAKTGSWFPTPKQVAAIIKYQSYK